MTVTYDSQSGSAVSSGSTTTGGSISSSPVAPTRSGYTFNGWFAAASGGSAISFPYVHGQTANFTLYAQWTAVVTCANGGVCVVGNTGPGGGTVFYVGSSTINSATGISSGGKYLEFGSLTTKTYSCWTGDRIRERRTLGDGALNTKEITAICSMANGAAYYAANLTEGGKSDWFLPSSGELEQMFSSRSSTGIAATGVYLSSTDTNTNSAMTVDFGQNAKLAALYRDTVLNVRPIRAFG